MTRELYPFQDHGARWLADRRHALLADDMGLGKTGQAITALDLVQARTVVVVCPGFVRANWHRELGNFSRTYRETCLIYDSARQASAGNVTITSYGLAHSAKSLPEIDVLILDEARFIKTPEAQRTKLIMGKGGLVHVARRTWALDGTPTPNHPGELWVLLHVFGVFPKSYDAFLERYCRTEMREHGLQVTGAKNVPELRELIKPITLRRKRGDVLKDLPPVRHEILTIEPDELPDDAAQRLELELDHEDDLMSMAEAERTPVHEGNKKTPLTTLRRLTAEAKAKGLADVITHELISGQLYKALVFGWFREPISLLDGYLRQHFSGDIIWGGTAEAKRVNKLSSFINNRTKKYLIMNIAVGGTGVDGLQHVCADAFFLETTFNPADTAQAVARIHRHGQSQPVLIRHATLPGSLDEKVMKVCLRKVRLASALFD